MMRLVWDLVETGVFYSLNYALVKGIEKKAESFCAWLKAASLELLS